MSKNLKILRVGAKKGEILEFFKRLLPPCLWTDSDGTNVIQCRMAWALACYRKLPEISKNHRRMQGGQKGDFLQLFISCFHQFQHQGTSFAHSDSKQTNFENLCRGGSRTANGGSKTVFC